MFRRGDASDSDESDVVEFTRRKKPVKPKEDGEDEVVAVDDATAQPEEEDDGGEGGLFGNLLEMADEQAADGTAAESSSTVRSREFPLPKHLPTAFTLPKKLLSDMTLGGNKNVVQDARGPRTVAKIDYEDLSKGSRVKRVKLTLHYMSTAHFNAKAAKAKGKDSKSKSSQASSRTPGSGLSTPLKASSESLQVVGGEGSSSSTPPPAPPAPPTFSHASDPNILSVTMHDLGCPTLIEAENYASLIAVHELTTGTPHSRLYSATLGLRPDNYEVHPDPLSVQHDLPLYQPINARNLPVPYRDLWDELEAKRKSRQDALDRQIWKSLDGVLRTETETARNGTQSGPSNTTTSTEDANPERAEKSYTKRQARPAGAVHPRLKADFADRVASPKYQEMARQRATLPMAAFRDTIIDTLAHNQVLVLSGETGCGKSTQLPSFIVEDQLSQGKDVKVVVCEPRRISAISLANRVADELGELRPPSAAGDGGLVGYQVRLDSTVGRNTRLSFVTYGIALRMLEMGADEAEGAFDEVTHIIVDEVHERSIDSDFLLIVLHSLMRRRPELKVVLMSATLEASKISSYFGGCPVLEVPGRTFPVNHKYIEDIVEYSGYQLDKGKSQLNLNNDKLQMQYIEDEEPEDLDEEDGAEEGGESSGSGQAKKRYSAQTLEIVGHLNPRQIPYALIVKLIEKLDADTSGPLAVLVFLPGMREIKQLTEMCEDHRTLGNRKNWKVFPLHSSIDSAAQQAVFAVSPTGRKLVVSTNIAETGVTIPDINVVIDVGKHREMRYDEKRGISRLMETWIAQSNAKQRAGRAGRVQEGTCYHVYTEERHLRQMAPHPLPEIMRLSLQDLALRCKLLRVDVGGSITDILSKALDPPTTLNIARAVQSLIDVGALNVNEELLPLGKYLGHLPIDVHLGKFLLIATVLGCLDPALTIAATLNLKSPFSAPFGAEKKIDRVKAIHKVADSDFLTYHNVFQQWRKLCRENVTKAKAFCRSNYLSWQTLTQIEELRVQLYSYLIDSGLVAATAAEKESVNRARYYRGGFVPSFLDIAASVNTRSEDEAIVNAALVAGLYPKVLQVDPDGLLRSVNAANGQIISPHPTSVNYRQNWRKLEPPATFVVYYSLQQTKKLFASETAPIDALCLYLLCGETAECKIWSGALSIEGKARIKFNVKSKTALALHDLRGQFLKCIDERLNLEKPSPESERWFKLAIDCISPPKEVKEEAIQRIGIRLQ